MRTALLQTWSQPLFLYRIIEAVVAVALVVALSVLWQDVARRQGTILEAQQRLKNEPARISQTATVKKDLASFRDDIARLEGLVLSREMIGTLVGTLEAEAARTRVLVRVPEISEEVTLNEKRQPILATGPLRDARLTLEASGKPENLLVFLHAVEHVPYLVRVTEWSIQAQAATAAPTVNVLIPPDPDGTTVPSTPVDGELTATVLVAIKNDHETK